MSSAGISWTTGLYDTDPWLRAQGWDKEVPKWPQFNETSADDQSGKVKTESDILKTVEFW